MAKKNFKKVLVATACAAVLIMGSVTTCFAATTNPASTPAHMTVPVTSIDFTITDKIDMIGAANSTDLTVENLEVTNNSKVGVIGITSIEADPVDGWNIAAQDTVWTKLAKDADTFGLKADGVFDMATGPYADAGSIEPGATDTTTFTGNVGLITEAINDKKVADIIVTVAYQ